MDQITERRAFTTGKIKKLVGELKDTRRICADKACVYATGSFGRGEAGAFSDLDLFIVGRTEQSPECRRLSRLDEICLKANLISIARKLRFPEFSGDGQYLEYHSAADFVNALGTPADDSRNTFTGRLLLLLESTCLVERSVYREAIDCALTAYWRDFPDHAADFAPAFLANDILRLWRTFCVNYEAQTRTEPPEKKIKRRLKNYKLKNSRLLTCYSAILYLLGVFAEAKTVTPADALQMVSLSPTKRIEALRSMRAGKAAVSALTGILDSYGNFLAATRGSEDAQLGNFRDPAKAKERARNAEKLGQHVLDSLNRIGGGNRFHQLLIV